MDHHFLKVPKIPREMTHKSKNMRKRDLQEALKSAYELLKCPLFTACAATFAVV